MQTNHELDSRRMQAVQTAVIPEIAQLIEQNPGTISLGQGVVHYGPPASIREILNDSMLKYENQLYGSVKGQASLIQALEDKLAADNKIALKDDYEIVVTAGANMGFLNALFAITNPDDEIILLSPYYFNHAMAAQMLNCHVKSVKTDSHYQPVLEEIEAAINSYTRAIVTVSPNNPSGAVYSRDSLEAINQLCSQRGLYHITDEAYEYFTFEEHEHYSPASFTGAGKHTISLFSLSKSYGFASWRIGYMVLPKHLCPAVQKAQDTNLICASLPSQLAAQELIRIGKKYCCEHLPSLIKNREICFRQLESLQGLCNHSDGNGAFYILLSLETEMNSLTLTKQLIEEHKIATVPGTTFGLEEGCYLRISYAALDNAEFDQAIKRLSHGIKEILS